MLSSCHVNNTICTATSLKNLDLILHGRSCFQEIFQQGSKMTSHFTNEVFIYYSALHVMKIDACLDRLLR